jgi:Skp family chaperone for outer membrane proteins
MFKRVLSYGFVLSLSVTSFCLASLNEVSTQSSVASGVTVKEGGALVSIDSLELMRQSKEGKLLAGQIKKEIDNFQEEVKKSQKELTDMQEELSKQAKVLNEEALQEKGEKLAQRKKDLERKLADQEESLRLKLQKKQITLREKQMAIAREVFEKKNWGVMIDSQMPGVLCVAKAIDKTDDILSVVDARYSEKSTVVSNQSKTSELLSNRTGINKTTRQKTLKVA